MSYNVKFVDRVGTAPGTTSLVVGPTNFSGTLGDAWIEPPSIYPCGPNPVYPYITPPPGFPGAPSIASPWAPAPPVVNVDVDVESPEFLPVMASSRFRRPRRDFRRLNPYATESTLRGLGTDTPGSFFSAGLPSIFPSLGGKLTWLIGGFILGYIVGR